MEKKYIIELNEQPSGITKAQKRALQYYPGAAFVRERCIYELAYEQSQKDIIALIEKRISEILGDAQPKPALRAELREMIERIKEDGK